jgi:hypothetical protein
MDWIFPFAAGIGIGFVGGALFVRFTFKLTPLDADPILDEPSSSDKPGAS